MSHKCVFFICFLLCSFDICFAQQPKLMLPIGHTKLINSAQFSPDAKRIVTASSDKTAKIWDVASGNLLLNLKGDSAEVTSAQYSRDGKNIVTASDSSAKIWDADKR
jgi:WD40 repeat protein